MITQARKLEIVTKHAKKYARKSESRPILQGIHYATNGSVVITDTHQLLRARNTHGFDQPFTSHYKTGHKLDGMYPDTDRLFTKESDHKFELEGDALKDALAFAKIARDLGKITDKKKPIAGIEFQEGQEPLVRLQVEGKAFNFECSFAEHGQTEPLLVHFNAEFLVNGLEVFKDAGSRKIKFNFYGGFRPITMIDEENEIDVLFLPIRMRNGEEE